MQLHQLQCAIEELVRETEDVVDEAAYVDEDGFGPEMSLAQLGTHLREEGVSGRLRAMDARHHARVALKAFEDGDLEAAQQSLMYGLRSWNKALQQVSSPEKRPRLRARQEPPGRRPKAEDVELFQAASKLLEWDNSLTLIKACRAAISALPHLGTAYGHLTDAGIRAAFRRGRTKAM